MIISIDFSILSPGVCILDNDQKIHFACFPYKDVVKQHIVDSLRDSGVYCDIRERNEDKSNLNTQSRFHTEEAINLGKLMAKYIETFDYDKENIVIFEGFSFNSGGNRLAQISGYQYLSRYFLLDKFSKIDSLFIYAPQSVKSTARAAKKGMGKVDMITSFIDDDSSILKGNKFHEDISDDPMKFKNIPTKRTKKIVFQKPIDDIVDSYWLLKTYFKKENFILK